MTQDRDGHVARVHLGIDAKTSIPTGKAKPALASQEPALNSRNGFPGGEGALTLVIDKVLEDILFSSRMDMLITDSIIFLYPNFIRDTV